MRIFIIVSSLLVVAFVATPVAPAQADECDKLTYLTFSAPVELPGVTLPAGTYRFEHLDCTATPAVLRVTSEDGTRAYGMFSTTVEQRSTASTRPEVIFAEMPSGSPEAIKAWFYPGDRTGDGLIYSKKQAAKLTRAPVQRVFATNDLG
jgi:hypothetical protein